MENIMTTINDKIINRLTGSELCIAAAPIIVGALISTIYVGHRLEIKKENDIHE